MSVQNRSNNANLPFVLTGPSYYKGDATILQDAGRAAVLAFGTIMAKIVASGKYVPFSDETATNGTAVPAGIYTGAEIAAADLVAGDVVDIPILIGGACTVDLAQIVIENSKTLGTIINATGGADNIWTPTVKDVLAMRGIFTEETVAISGFENA